MRNSKQIFSLVVISIVIITTIQIINTQNDTIRIKKYLLANITKNQQDNVVYMILTSEKTLPSRGLSIWETWAGSCNDVYFTCNCENVLKVKNMKKNNENIPHYLLNYKEISEVPILQVNFKENYNTMGKKVLMILDSIYDMYKNSTKWFFMVDDDTYVFTKNLEKFISTQDASKPLYYGFKYKHKVEPVGFIGGGSGILFTTEAMRRIVKKIKSHECDRFTETLDEVNYGDLTIGECARLANISIGDSHDEKGKPRFNYVSPKLHYEGPLPDYLWKYGTHNQKLGRECCSAESISFHYLTPEDIYAIHSNKTLLTDMFS